MKKQFIAYKGAEYTIEWYFDSRGKSPALEYYEKLAELQQDKLDYLFEVLADIGEIRNEEKFRNEGDKIYAFKPKPDRFLCFFHLGSKIIVTNAFEKKADKLPQREKQKALFAREDYLLRCKKGMYYDE